MKVIGLTGGIATGKSIVTSMLQELGAKVVDADQLAREIVQPGHKAWQDILRVFGSDILHGDQTINREKLRKLVFNDVEARKKLNSITHPHIRKMAQEKIAQLAAAGTDVTVYVAPLFFENKVHLWLRPVILVSCDLATQKKRLRERDGLSDEEIENHLRAQMSLEEKKKLADIVIDNSGELHELRQQVEKVWKELIATSLAPDTDPPKGPHAPGRQSE
jgi:dephospho-CoA kinase